MAGCYMRSRGRRPATDSRSWGQYPAQAANLCPRTDTDHRAARRPFAYPGQPLGRVWTPVRRLPRSLHEPAGAFGIRLYRRSLRQPGVVPFSSYRRLIAEASGSSHPRALQRGRSCGPVDRGRPSPLSPRNGSWPVARFRDLFCILSAFWRLWMRRCCTRLGKGWPRTLHLIDEKRDQCRSMRDLSAHSRAPFLPLLTSGFLT